MLSNDDSAALVEQVRHAIENESPVRIVGGDTKAFMGNQLAPDVASALYTRRHEGVISYDPTELVVTVRSGTQLSDLHDTLAEAGQMLPFEPPSLKGSTIGGVLACGLSGPRRPFSGSARDYVLGVRIINGQAQDLSFGGEVMKNVAGYDVSRLQIGAWGTLGVLLDISMKVLPKPELELTLLQNSKRDDLQPFARLMRKPLPLSGAMLIDEARYIRLSGSEDAVRSAAKALGGSMLDDNDVWNSVRDHEHPFFQSAQRAVEWQGKTLWRISVADYMPALGLSGDWLHEWGGAQRWLLTSLPSDEVFRIVGAAKGHATRYSEGQPGDAAFQPLSGPMRSLQTRVRNSFDAYRLFNRGRFHPELDVSSKLAAAGA